MSVAHLTHKIVRQTVETLETEHLTRDGEALPVTIVTHRISCMCGRVFATGSELMTMARYLGHLPTPKDPRERGNSE